MNKRKKKKSVKAKTHSNKRSETTQYKDNTNFNDAAPVVKEEITPYTFEARVKVVGKRVDHVKSGKHDFTVRILSFKFSDGSIKDITVPERKTGLDKTFDLTVINDTGILSYYDRYDYIMFNNFKRDHDCNNTKLNFYEKLYKTGMGKNLLIIISVF